MRYLVELVNKFPRLEDIQGNAREIAKDLISNMELNLLYRHFGVKPDKSFLLYGPPGTGKTLSMKVINNEMNKDIKTDSDDVIKDLNLVTMD